MSASEQCVKIGPLLFILITLAIGCGGDAPAGPSSVHDLGEARLVLTAAAQGTVPSQASDALVRLWNPSTGFDARERVEVPDPGSSTDVLFTAPSGSGYSVGVITYKDGNPPEALAAGISSTFSVSPGETTQVPISVEPWELELSSAPDTLVSGAETTVQARVTSGPASILAPRFGATLCLDTSQFTVPCSVATSPSGDLTGDAVSVTFNAPTVETVTRLYFQFTLGIDGREWTPEDFNVGAGVYLPSLTLGDSLFSRPIKPSAGSVIVIIS